MLSYKFLKYFFSSILLHAKIKEYTICHALSSVWLRHPDNFHKDGYSDLVSVCIQHILLPQGKANLIPQYIDTCPGLEDKEKQQILERFRAVIQTLGSCNKNLSTSDTNPELDEDEQLDSLPVTDDDDQKRYLKGMYDDQKYYLNGMYVN